MSAKPFRPPGEFSWTEIESAADTFTKACLYRRSVGIPGTPGLLNLSYNENPLGPSPKAMAAYVAAREEIHRYPNVSSPGLRRALADELRVPEETIAIGSGATHLIGHLGGFLLRDRRVAAASVGCLFSYRFVSLATGSEFRSVPLRNDLGQDLHALRSACGSSGVIFLADPNNPTGLTVGAEKLLELHGSLPKDVVLIVDQAYLDFAEDVDSLRTMASVAARCSNLVVVRTFSKIYGLAGLRVGYAISSPPLIRRLSAFQRLLDPGCIALPAELAAVAALEDDQHYNASRAYVSASRNRLQTLVGGYGLQATTSNSNFILIRSGRYESDLARDLERHEILVTRGTDLELPGHVRVAVPHPGALETLETALHTILSRLSGATECAY